MLMLMPQGLFQHEAGGELPFSAGRVAAVISSCPVGVQQPDPWPRPWVDCQPGGPAEPPAAYEHVDWSTTTGARQPGKSDAAVSGVRGGKGGEMIQPSVCDGGCSG